MPSARVSREEIRGPLGPPDFMLHDFPMWFAVRHFGFVFDSMFGSTERPVGLYSTLLPVAPRREGIRVDETITNLDMAVNFDSYPVEAITAPILVVHARDDPMAKFAEVEKFIERADPQTAVFETGGHLITGHRDEVSRRITLFIDRVVDGHERSD